MNLTPYYLLVSSRTNTRNMVQCSFPDDGRMRYTRLVIQYVSLDLRIRLPVPITRVGHVVTDPNKLLGPIGARYQNHCHAKNAIGRHNCQIRRLCLRPCEMEIREGEKPT